MIGTCPLQLSRLPVVAVAVLATAALWSAPAAAEADAVSRPSGLDTAVGLADLAGSARQARLMPQVHRVHRVHRIERVSEVQSIQKAQKAQRAQGVQKVQKVRRFPEKRRFVSRVARNKQIGMGLADRFGWGGERQWRCLERLWTRESGWNHLSHNPRSGAHGIPQALPGSKMEKVAEDWRTNPETQITWGLRYIRGRYGTPCAAWAHFGSSGWY